MQALANAQCSELASRTISFLASTYGSTAGGSQEQEEEDLHRLRRLLLRSGTVVEEAESRRVTNSGMLRQLGALRDEMLRGYYVLDTIRYQALPPAAVGARGARGDDDADGRRRLTFGPSRFNPAKRVRFRFNSGDSEATVVLRRASSRELRQMVSRLEDSIADTKELVLFLTRCPLLHRQPYSAHLFVDKYMFGRHAERDLVVEFLLGIEHPGATTNPGVLPIVGPRFIGKSTLVEHVCNDERVREHFSIILFYRGNGLLEDETMASFMENCVIKHQNNSSLGERSLIVIELVGDLDDETWKRLYHSSGRRLPQGSKMILTSRSESIARFGTTQTLRLKCLSTEAFWYFFKLLVFGSTDPGEHPGLASMAMEMALEARGSFMTAYTMAALLRADFSKRSWCKVVGMARRQIQRNVAVFDQYPDDFKAKPWHVGRMDRLEPDQHFLVYDSYQKDYSQQEVLPDPEITLVDLLSGRVHRRGRFEILHWKSIIPPYFSYISPCEIFDTQDMPCHF